MREYNSERPLKEIAEHYGSTQSAISYWLKKWKIPRRFPIAYSTKDLTGQSFGRLVVESYRRGSKWVCLCDCGSRTTVSGSSLKDKLTRSCGCLKSDLSFQGVGELSKSYWSRVLKGAEKRKLHVDITLRYAWELFLKQDSKCALSGIPIVIVRDYTHKHDLHTASLDRIDHYEGYVEGNVQWVHRKLNMMRRRLPLEEFIWFCRKVAEYHV